MIRAGFIGTGNMGGALATAVARANEEYEILLTNRTKEKAVKLEKELKEQFGAKVRTAADNNDIAANADYIFLGVKPQMMEDMLKGIAASLQERTLKGDKFTLVTMAAGLSISRIKEMAGGDYQVIRIMPNTPAAIGEGMTLYSAPEVPTAAVDALVHMLQASGRLCELPEKLIDAGSAVSGCGPAFVYMFIEALADGGVNAGLPRAKAYELAAKMVEGSAAMVLERGRHPGELKDAVCSPGGTTIEGVRVLEEGGLRGLVMDAVIAAYEKNFALR